jgi:hypothetical protein
MKRTMMNKKVQHLIDLTKIDGDGAFPCPKCTVVISPEDATEEVYKIADTKVNNNQLVELTIICNNCKTRMKLTGFNTQ